MAVIRKAVTSTVLPEYRWLPLIEMSPDYMG
jgi:hypothetical protein